MAVAAVGVVTVGTVAITAGAIAAGTTTVLMAAASLVPFPSWAATKSI